MILLCFFIVCLILYLSVLLCTVKLHTRFLSINNDKLMKTDLKLIQKLPISKSSLHLQKYMYVMYEYSSLYLWNWFISQDYIKCWCRNIPSTMLFVISFDVQISFNNIDSLQKSKHTRPTWQLIIISFCLQLI